ncbi:MAG: hypothetical protein ABFD82_04390 [Syntrophaceae bacterium]
MAVNENNPELEIIAVKIGNTICGTYKGLGGTFASFIYCCLDKKVLPGFHDKGIIAEAELKDKSILLRLSGKRLYDELMEVMDIALLNIGALPHAVGKAECFIEVKLNNKEG